MTELPLEEGRYRVWVHTVSGRINSITEARAVESIEAAGGSDNYIYFFAELAPPVEEVEA